MLDMCMCLCCERCILVVCSSVILMLSVIGVKAMLSRINVISPPLFFEWDLL